MKQAIHLIKAIGVLCALSACGGGEISNPAPITVQPDQKGSNNTSYFNNQDSGPVFYNGQVVSTVFDNRVDGIFFERDVTDQPFDSQLKNGKIITVRANSGKTHAFVFGNQDSGPLFTQYGRSTVTEIPTFGAATYSGDYTGLIKRGSNGSGKILSAKVLGDISLDVDFASSDVSGSITNRASSISPAFRYEDVRLTGTLDGDGYIAGNAIGGRPLYTDSANRAQKSFGAAIGGEDGSRVSGYTRTEWATGPSTARVEHHEAGAFFAQKEE